MPHNKSKQPAPPRPGKDSGVAKEHPNENESAKEWERKQAPVPADEGGRTAEQQPKPATRVQR
jgi:hypothetical protein